MLKSWGRSWSRFIHLSEAGNSLSVKENVVMELEEFKHLYSLAYTFHDQPRTSENLFSYNFFNY